MRPLKLTMQAFGSYGEKVTVDFEKPSQNLFLITGDTGSGKSTIFDAIVFALYGETGSESNKKDGTELQSQYVDTSVSPYVSLEFSETRDGENLIYTVTRVPKHRRKKLRRTGSSQTMDSKETVSLILPDGREFSQNKAETDGKLEEIVGLSKQQFMQVAMIAQGEFVRLLRARSSEKKVIFRKLFNTELYETIVDRLDGRRKDQEAKISEIRTACRTEVSHIQVPEAFPRAEELAALRDEVVKEGNLGNLNQLMELLEELTQYESLRLKAGETELTAAAELQDRKRNALTQGTALQKAYSQKAAAEEKLKAAEAQASAMIQAEQLAEQIGAAYEILQIHNRLTDAGKHLTQAQQELEKQNQLLPQRTEEAKKAALEDARAQNLQNTRLEAFSSLSTRVEKALAILEQIRQTEAAIRKKAAAAAAAEEAAQDARDALSSFQDKVKQQRQRLEELADAGAKLTAWESRKREARGLRVDLETLDSLQEAVRKEKEACVQALATFREIQAQYTEKNRESEAAKDAFYSAQAGLLAREKLVEGQPCPVCGSCFHPAPCVLPESHRDLTRAYVEALQKEADALQDRRNKASEASGTAQALLKTRQETFSIALENFRGRLSQSVEIGEQDLLPDLWKKLRAWDLKLDTEGTALQKDALESDQLRQTLSTAEGTQMKLTAQAEEADRQARDREKVLVADRASLESLIQQKDYPTEEEAQAALRVGRQEKEAAEEAYRKAHSLSQACQTALDQTRERITRLSESLPDLEADQAQRQQNYRAIMEAKALTEDQWQALTRDHSQSEIPGLRQLLQTHAKEKAAAQGMLEAADATIAGRELPDLSILEEEKQQAEAALAALQDRINGLRQSAIANGRTYRALAPKMEERARIGRDYARVNGLYRRLHGSEKGAHMDIETFVQRYYLQRILCAANKRFREMSAGQFELQMTDVQEAGSGSNKGLDLMVYSAVTGKVREVRTLSGGESFMAALSLALGMADQIQAASAAIHLDMMFIDEGFGSLDAHSRDQAVRVLQQMAGGSRLIGIISHVTELKQAIDDQLLVTKDERGSHISWQIS